MLALQINAEAEEEDNVAEQKRQQGKRVLYGQIVQVHVGRLHFQMYSCRIVLF